MAESSPKRSKEAADCPAMDTSDPSKKQKIEEVIPQKQPKAPRAKQEPKAPIAKKAEKKPPAEIKEPVAKKAKVAQAPKATRSTPSNSQPAPMSPSSQ